MISADFEGAQRRFASEANNAFSESFSETEDVESPNALTPAIDFYRPFPVDELPSPLSKFVAEGAAALGCDPSYIALPMLSVLASAIGATRCMAVKSDWKAPSILWSAIIGESGDGKSPAFRHAVEPLREAQHKALELAEKAEREYQARMARYKKDYEEWKRKKLPLDEMPSEPGRPEARRYLIDDVTVESVAPILQSNSRGVLLARDELSGWLKSFDQYKPGGRGGADRANWLSMYNGDSILIDRKTGEPKTISVPTAYVSVCGGIQPGILRRCLNQEDRESGLAARILFAFPPRRSREWSDSEITPQIKAAYAATVRRLLSLEFKEGQNGKPEPILLHFYPPAKDAWIKFYDRHAHEMEALDGEMAAAWSKLEEIPVRLAIIIHCVKDEDDEFITEATMKSAIALTEWFKHEARRVYAMFSETVNQRDDREFLEWARKKGGTVTIRMVMRRFAKRFPKAEAVKAAFQEYEKTGYGSVCRIPGQCGRPSIGFALKEGQ